MKGVAALLAKTLFPHYRLPRQVISDRDTWITAKLIKEWCNTLGIEQNISTAYHPQTDGQSERANQWVEQYLWMFINHQQNNWADLVLGKFGLVQVFALFFSTPNQMGVPFGGSFDSEVWINLKKPQAGLRVQFGVWQKRA